jgi:hypothetical protein
MSEKETFAKLANKDSGGGRMSKKISIAVETLIKELGITNGSLKFFIRGGNASPTIEVQNSVEIADI